LKQIDAIKAAMDGKFVYCHSEGVIASSRSPFTGEQISDVVYWWRDLSGNPRTAPMTIMAGPNGLDGYYTKAEDDLPAEMPRTLFRAFERGPLSVG
jgi:hypothetical protein